MQRLLVWCPSAPQVVTIRQSPGKASQHLKWRYGSHLKDRFPLQGINLDHRFRCAWTDWDSIGWEIIRISLYVCHDCDINIVCASDTLFTKRRDVLPPHLVKPQSRHIWRLFPLPPGACQISERYDHYNIESRLFKASRDLAVKHLIA